jgi:hypothetical protein
VTVIAVPEAAGVEAAVPEAAGVEAAGVETLGVETLGVGALLCALLQPARAKRVAVRSMARVGLMLVSFQVVMQ